MYFDGQEIGVTRISVVIGVRRKKLSQGASVTRGGRNAGMRPLRRGRQEAKSEEVYFLCMLHPNTLPECSSIDMLRDGWVIEEGEEGGATSCFE